MNNKLIEALLYIQGDKGLSPKQLASASKISVPEARKGLKAFTKDFNEHEHGIKVMNFNEVFKFATIEELKEQVSEFATIEKKQKLSQASIETIGIIAYKQPITKSQVNNIRGVSSEGVFLTLLTKGLIEEVGIAPTPGAPVLYGVTNKFYDYFQIQSLKELPKLSQFADEDDTLEDDFDLYSSQRTDN